MFSVGWLAHLPRLVDVQHKVALREISSLPAKNPTSNNVGDIRVHENGVSFCFVTKPPLNTSNFLFCPRIKEQDVECIQTEFLKVYVKSKRVPLSFYKKEKKNLIDLMKN